MTTVEASATQQQSMKTPEPQKEHEWLGRLVGDWTFEGEAAMEPGKPSEKFKGTERVRSLGGLWFIAEGDGEMPDGSPARTLMTLGYDPQKKKFVGTFIGTMMTNLWIYEGELDAAKGKLTLDTEGPNMAHPGKTAKFKDTIELSDGRRVMTSQVKGDDGKWNQVMTMTYQRKK